MSEHPMIFDQSYPDDWSVLQTPDLLVNRKGAMKIGPFGSQLRKDMLKSKGYRVYGQENVFEKDFDLGYRFISPSHFEQLRSCEIQPGDFLITMMGTVGKCAVAPANIEPGVMDSHLLRLQINSSVFIAGFLCHLMSASDIIARQIRRLSVGGIMEGLSSRIIEQLQYPAPDVPEQRSIAAILDAMDEAIRRTEALIAKLQKVKAGLLHNLLTRGLDKHGQLRDPIRHPEQFKDSDLGRIPQEWEVTTVGDVLRRFGGFVQTGPFGSQLHSHEYTPEGVPVIMPQDINGGIVEEFFIARIPEMRAQMLARHRVREGDVIFARRGDLSRCAAVGMRESGWICGTGCLLLRTPSESLNHNWFAHVYRHDVCQRQIAISAVGSTMVNLNCGLISALQFAMAPVEEQQEHIRRIDNLTRSLTMRNEELRVLSLMKQGLMQDLLTGQVRVLGSMIDRLQFEHREGLDVSERSISRESLRPRDPLQVGDLPSVSP